MSRGKSPAKETIQTCTEVLDTYQVSDAELLVSRAEAHILNEDYDAAQADYQRAHESEDSNRVHGRLEARPETDQTVEETRLLQNPRRSTNGEQTRSSTSLSQTGNQMASGQVRRRGQEEGREDVHRHRCREGSAHGCRFVVVLIIPGRSHPFALDSREACEVRRRRRSARCRRTSPAKQSISRLQSVRRRQRTRFYVSIPFQLIACVRACTVVPSFFIVGSFFSSSIFLSQQQQPKENSPPVLYPIIRCYDSERSSPCSARVNFNNSKEKPNTPLFICSVLGDRERDYSITPVTRVRGRQRAWNESWVV